MNTMLKSLLGLSVTIGLAALVSTPANADTFNWISNNQSSRPVKEYIKIDHHKKLTKNSYKKMFKDPGYSLNNKTQGQLAHLEGNNSSSVITSSYPNHLVITPGGYRWKNTNITYRIDTSSKQYTKMWQQAVKAWNNYRVVHLVPARSSESPDVTLRINKGINDSYAGLATLTCYSQPIGTLPTLKSVTSTVYADTCNAYLYTRTEKLHVAEHELGHALGLEHSTSHDSVMYPVVCDHSLSKGDELGLQDIYQK